MEYTITIELDKSDVRDYTLDFLEGQLEGKFDDPEEKIKEFTEDQLQKIDAIILKTIEDEITDNDPVYNNVDFGDVRRRGGKKLAKEMGYL